MNDLTLLDYYIRGAMAGAGMLTFGALCWWMARMERKRWSAEHRGEHAEFFARASRAGHGGS
jgi:hypothetical protein